MSISKTTNKTQQTQKHKSRPSANPRNPAVTLPSRHAAGGTPGRPAHAGQASQRRRAQRWSRRFGGLPVRGTAPHCATPRSAGQLLASPTTPGSRRRPHPTVRTRWVGHVWSGRTILPCVLDGQTTDVFLFSPALDALFFGLPRLSLAKSTQVCCALHTSAHTTRYACLNILSMIRGFCASPWPGHSVR